ncbi:MAG TPA: helix-turn-helix domain-containing protein [Xanthobacteraceae bacterium]
MAYRHTENVARKLLARRAAILEAACRVAGEQGMAAVQIAPVAERAGVATGTVYRYFSSKAELVSALVRSLLEKDLAELDAAAQAAPGPLSALAATVTTFAVRALARRRLTFALVAEPVEPELDAARGAYRRAVAAALERLIRRAVIEGRVPEQDAQLAAAALVGALIGGLIGPLAPASDADPAQERTRAQTIALFALRALGVIDARARGLVAQAAAPISGPARLD